MAWKKRRLARQVVAEQMARLESLTAGLIVTYSEGEWDTVLAMAERLEPLLKPLGTIPRMNICLYHVESIQLRIACLRKDIALVETVARKSNNVQVSELANRTVMRMVPHSCDHPDRDRMGADSILEETLGDLGTTSSEERQISRMTNPDPSLIGTVWLPSLYRA